MSTPTSRRTRTARSSFLWAHVGWLLVIGDDMQRMHIFARYAKDMLRDPFYRRLDNRPPISASSIGSWFVCSSAPVSRVCVCRRRHGRRGGAVRPQPAGLGRVRAHGDQPAHTWAVNSVTHMWGYRNYETDEESRNNFIVGLLRQWARAGTTTITPIRARPATATLVGVRPHLPDHPPASAWSALPTRSSSPTGIGWRPRTGSSRTATAAD